MYSNTLNTQQVCPVCHTCPCCGRFVAAPAYPQIGYPAQPSPRGGTTLGPIGGGLPGYSGITVTNS